MATLADIQTKLSAIDARVKQATAPLATLQANYTALENGSAVPAPVQTQLDAIDAAATQLAADVEGLVAPLGLPQS